MHINGRVLNKPKKYRLHAPVWLFDELGIFISVMRVLSLIRSHSFQVWTRFVHSKGILRALLSY